MTKKKKKKKKKKKRFEGCVELTWENVICTEELVAFAKLVAQHTLSNIDPSKFMSYQEGVEAGRLAEREACLKDLKNVFSTFDSLPASPEITLIKRFCSIFFEAFTVAINERIKP